ncbi:hypothetical protein ABPG74_017660 [Tetrahymena malaccensis]
MKKQLTFAIFLQQLILLNCQQCNNQGQFFDYINRQCLNCDESCLSCYGPSQNQCSQCNDNYYFLPQYSSCQKKCEANMQANNNERICMKCQIFGCQQCDQSNTCVQCFQNMELKKDGLCYQKQDICKNKQLYDFRSNECVYSCQKNTIENYQQKICENIIDCNLIDEYSQYQIQEEIQIVFAIPDERIVIVQKNCIVSIANFNLQITQQFQLLPTTEFTSQIQKIYEFEGIVFCLSNLNFVFYEVTTEQLIKFPLTESFDNIYVKNYIKNFKVFVFYSKTHFQLVLYSVKNGSQLKVDFPNRQLDTFIISIKLQIACVLTLNQIPVKALFFKVQLDGSIVLLETKNMDCKFAAVINDDSDTIRFQLSKNINKQKHNDTYLKLLYYYEFKRIIIAYSKIEYKLQILQINENYDEINSKFIQNIDRQFDYSFIIKSIQTDYIELSDSSNYRYYIPIDENLLNITSLSQFEYLIDFPINNPKNSIIYNKQIYFVFQPGQKKLNIFFNNLQGQNKESKSITSEGYNNDLYFTYSYQSIQNSFFGIKNRYYSSNILQTSIGFIQEQNIPLPFYQNEQIQKSIIVNQQIVSDDQFKSVYFLKRIINSECLFVLVYLTQDESYQLQIIDICAYKTILRELVPFLFIEYTDITQDCATLIVEFNYIIVFYYKMLIDLTNNRIIQRFYSNPFSLELIRIQIFNDQLIIIDNQELKMDFFSLKTNTYLENIFLEEYVELVTEKIENQVSPLFVDNYIYVYLDLIKYEISTQTIKRMQVLNLKRLKYKLSFLGSNAGVVLKDKYVINYQLMKILKIFDQHDQNYYFFFYPKNYASINIIINNDSQQIVQSFNIENKPYISFPKNPSFSLFYFHQQSYQAFYFDKSDSKILKLKLISQEQNEYQINASLDQIQVDTLIDAIIFTTKANQFFDLNILYFNKSNQIQKLFTYDSIYHFQICQTHSKAIIQSNLFSFWIVDYINILQKEINFTLKGPSLQLPQYMINCDDNIILQYSPVIQEFLIKESKQNPIQYYSTQFYLYFPLTVIQPIFEDKIKTLIIFSKEKGFNSLYKGKYSAQDNISFYNQTALFLDSKNNLLIGLDEIAQYLQIFDLLTLNQKYAIQLNNKCIAKNLYFDATSNQIILLDESLYLLQYDYLNNQVIQKKLQYQMLNGFKVDLQKNYIFLYDDYIVYVHKLPTLIFLETIFDQSNMNQVIKFIYLDTARNLLTIDNQAATNLYDLNQIVYTESFTLPQSQQIAYLSFDKDLYLFYNLRARQLSLFQKRNFKQTYLLEQRYESIQSLSYGQLLKSKDNTFIYQNLDFILYGLIDIYNFQIIKIAQQIMLQSIRDIFCDSQLNNLYLIEYFTNNIYKIDLNQTNKTQLFTLILIQQNKGQNLYFRGTIYGHFIVYYSQGTLFCYDYQLNELKSKELSNKNDIDFIQKLFYKNTKAVNNFSFQNQIIYSNIYDQQFSNLLLIIIQSESIIKILDLNTFTVVISIEVKYNILNFYLEQDRSLIYIVGDQGFTYVYTYQLDFKIQIINPCLLQTKIDTDELYLYIYCDTQLEIYNKFSVNKEFPTIYEFTNLNKIYYIDYQNLFIIVQNKMILVVRILKDDKKPIIIFKRDQNLLQILNFQIIIDQNDNRYLEIIAQNVIDIVKYLISLDSISTACSHQIDQSDSKQLNQFIQSIFKNTLINTNQQLHQEKILLHNHQEFYQNNLINNLNKIIYQSQPSYFNGQLQKSIVKLLNGDIFNNALIQNVQINSINLIIPQKQQILLNSQNNFKRLFLYDITIIEMQAELIIQNLELVHIKTLIFKNLNQLQMNNTISINNCSEVIIEDIQFENSVFNNGYVFKITNSTLIQIQGVKLFESAFDNFLIMEKIQTVQIKDVNISSSFFKTNFIEQYQNYNTTIQIIKCEKINGNAFIKQIGSQYLFLQDIQILNTNTNEFNFLKTEEYLDISNYKNLKVLIYDLFINNSDNIIFIIDSYEVELKNIQLKKLNQLNQSLFGISGQTISIENFNCSECNTLQKVYLTKITGIKIANLNNLILEQSNLSFFELMCQSVSKINLNDMKSNGVLSQISLVSIKNCNHLELCQSKFKNNQCYQDGCAFNINNIDNLIIQDSTFSNNISDQGKGGSIYLSEVRDTQITNSSFIENKSIKDYGGAFYYTGKIDQISLLRLSNQTMFQNNQALQGKGGAIYLSNVNLKIDQSYIIQNEAAVGGGIYYDSFIPDLFQSYDYEVTQFIKENKAKLYGHNLGSQLRSIEIDFNRIKQPSQQDNKHNTSNISDFMSGGYLSLENIQLKDEEGNYLQFLQINNLDLNKNLQQEIENLNLQIVPNEDIFVQGSSITKYSGKGFNFNFSITSKPLHKSSFLIQSNIILDLLSSKKGQIQQQIQSLFKVSFRECIIGEIKVNFANKIICEQCPDGKYSLDQADQSCRLCPNGAQECAGSIIKLFPGYWRANNYSDEIIQCSKNKFSCQPQKQTSKFGCEVGYVGPLCESCDFEGKIWGNRFSKSFQSRSCIQCSDSAIIIIISFLIFFFVQFFYLNFSVKKIIQQSERVLLGYYLKLAGFLHLSNTVYNFQQLIFFQTLVDHFQVISILDKYSLNLPKIFSFGTNTIGNPLEISNGSLDSSISQTLSCRKIGSKKYASIDLNIQCYDYDKHMKYILILVLPILAIFVIIIPIWILKQIKHLKQQKSSRFQLNKYEFLYADYKPKYYYWFKIKMYFKSIIMTASILLIEHPNIRAFMVNIVLVSYSLMTTKINPYISNQRNKLEQQSIFISILSINLTFLYQGIMNLSSYVTVVIYTLNAMFILKLILLAIVKGNKKQNKKISKLQINIIKDLTNLNKFKFKIPDSNTEQQNQQVRKRDVIFTQSPRQFVDQQKVEKIKLFQQHINQKESQQFLTAPLSFQFNSLNEFITNKNQQQKTLIDKDSQAQLTQNNLTQYFKNQQVD